MPRKSHFGGYLSTAMPVLRNQKYWCADPRFFLCSSALLRLSLLPRRLDIERFRPEKVPNVHASAFQWIASI
jgi:hypothetical protein